MTIDKTDPCQNGFVEVELHSADPSAVEAVKNTFAMLPGCLPDSFVERDGRFYVRSGFAAFAAENQGYVRRILR